MLVEILVVAAVSGLVQGLSGFAFGLIATAFWAWMMSPQQVVPLVVLSSLIGQLVSFIEIRSEIRPKLAGPFLIGGMLGVPLGMVVLQSLNIFVFRATVGIGIILLCAVMWRTDRNRKVQGNIYADGCVGVVSGFMAGACGIGGPPMTIWCALQKWPMRVQRATYQLFLIFIQVFIIAIMFWKGILHADILNSFYFIAPTVVVFSWTDSILARRLDQAQFRKIILLLLLLSGIALILPLLQAIFTILTAGR